jgi:SAM-dependent methyltransferase
MGEIDKLAPAPWLVQNIDLIPPDLPVLDVACGEGRNALFLARVGWTVHALDCDEAALRSLDATARKLELPIATAVVDLEGGTPALGSERFGAVVVFNYLHRALLPAIKEAVAVGGVLIYETFTAGQALRGRPTNPAFLLGDGELMELVKPLEILRSRAGDIDGKLVASVVALRQ